MLKIRVGSYVYKAAPWSPEEAERVYDAATSSRIGIERHFIVTGQHSLVSETQVLHAIQAGGSYASALLRDLVTFAPR